jgi:hypothetical protein
MKSAKTGKRKVNKIKYQDPSFQTKYALGRPSGTVVEIPAYNTTQGKQQQKIPASGSLNL